MNQRQKKIREVIGCCEKAYKDLQKNLPEEFFEQLRTDSFIAGGFLRDLLVDDPINDIDIFFTSTQAAHKFMHTLLRSNLRGFGLTVNNNLIFTTKKAKYNIIIGWSDPPLELLGSFNFTFNQHYYKPKDQQFYFDTNTFCKQGTFTPTGVYRTPLEVLVLQGFKFIQKGYVIDMGDLINLYLTSLKEQANEKTSQPFSLTELEKYFSSGNFKNFFQSTFSARRLPPITDTNFLRIPLTKG